MHGTFLKLLGQFFQDLGWKNRIIARRGAFFSAKISIIDLKPLKKNQQNFSFHKQLEK